MMDRPEDKKGSLLYDLVQCYRMDMTDDFHINLRDIVEEAEALLAPPPQEPQGGECQHDIRNWGSGPDGRCIKCGVNIPPAGPEYRLTPTPKASLGEEDGKPVAMDIPGGGVSDVDTDLDRPLTPSPQDGIGGLVRWLNNLVIMDEVGSNNNRAKEAAAALERMVEDIDRKDQCIKQAAGDAFKAQETIAALRSALEKIEKGSTAYVNQWQRDVARAATAIKDRKP